MDVVTDGQLVIIVTSIATLVSSMMATVTLLVNRKMAIAERHAETEEIIGRARAEASALLIATEAKAMAVRMEVQSAAEQLRIEALQAAAEVREDQRVNAEMLASKIAEVHVEAKRAYTEANHVNEKIEDLNKRLLHEEQSQEKQDASDVTGQKLDALQDSVNVIRDRPTAAKLDALQHTADEIDLKVDHLGKRQ